MKIGILIATLVPYGAERAALRLAQGLKDKGVDVTILVTDAPPSIQSGNVPVISMLHGGELNLAEELLYAPLQYIRLHRTIKKERFDVLISFMERANIFNLTLPGKHRRILTVHIYLKREFKESGICRRTLTSIFYTLFLHRADRLLCVSRASAADFANTFPIKSDKLGTMRNPCDIKHLLSLAQEPIEDPYRKLFEGNVIINVGCFRKQKGQWYLIRAFKKILETMPDVKLVFLGDGEFQSYAETLANDLGIKDKVHFLGYQMNPLKFMSKATVFAFPSLWEGYPVALVEALICKVPIISADCKSGPRELLAPDTDFAQTAQSIEKAEYGILIPPFDGEFKDADSPLTREESMLAEALLTLLQDSSLRQHYRYVGYQRADAFKTDRVVEEWMDVFRKL
jgi:glycosyltransferase involved in cell wall biosynthesis